MFEERIIGKVPGTLCQNPKEKQGYIEDLQSKTKVELCELLERQNKLLANKCFVAKLPDKGERIKAFKERIQEALTQCSAVQEACNLLSDLLISEKDTAQNIEWTGQLSHTPSVSEESDVELDESDPLNILATQGGAGSYKKRKNRYFSLTSHVYHLSVYFKMECLELDEDLKVCASSWTKISKAIVNDGFREGASIGHEKVFQDGFDRGYECGFRAAKHVGFIRGAVHVLKAFSFSDATLSDDAVKNDSLLHNVCLLCKEDKSSKSNQKSDHETMQASLNSGEVEGNIDSIHVQQEVCLKQQVEEIEQKYKSTLASYNIDNV